MSHDAYIPYRVLLSKTGNIQVVKRFIKSNQVKSEIVIPASSEIHISTMKYFDNNALNVINADTLRSENIVFSRNTIAVDIIVDEELIVSIERVNSSYLKCMVMD